MSLGTGDGKVYEDEFDYLIKEHLSPNKKPSENLEPKPGYVPNFRDEAPYGLPTFDLWDPEQPVGPPTQPTPRQIELHGDKVSVNWADNPPPKAQPGGHNPHNSPDIKTINLPVMLPTGWPGGAPPLAPGFPNGIPEGSLKGNTKVAGLLDWFFPSPKIDPSKPLEDKPVQGPKDEHFPTDADAAFAADKQNAYGMPYERYVNNEIVRVLGGRMKSTDAFTPTSLFDLDEDELNKIGISDRFTAATTKQMERVTPSIPTTSLGISNIPRVHNVFARAALAVARDPIASLGFDPEKTLLDIRTRSNIGGTTDPEGYYQTPGSRRMYANDFTPIPHSTATTQGDMAATVVHESIHNGIFRLLNGLYEGDTETPKKFKEIIQRLVDSLKKDKLDLAKSGFDFQEHSTRQIMRTVMGNPEYSDLLAKFREEGLISGEKKGQVKGGLPKDTMAAERFFETGPGAKHYANFLKEIQDLAAEAIAKKRPGGPR